MLGVADKDAGASVYEVQAQVSRTTRKRSKVDEFIRLGVVK